MREKCPCSELSWSAFYRIWTKYREMLFISLYSVQMQQNADQNNSEYRNFLRSVHLLQIIEKTNAFSKMYDILGFLNSLYLPQVARCISFTLIFLVIENILVLFCHYFHIRWEKINLYHLANFYLLSKN